MKVGYSPGSSFKLLTGPGSRLGLTLIITLMVISSPIVIFANPALLAAKGNNIDTSSQHSGFSLGDRSTPPMSPTNVSPLDSDFTTQSAITTLTARPTNNIVNTNSFYDIVFVTVTSGSIKTIQVTFPAGTTVPSSASFNEAEGIGPGTVSKSGQTLTYTVTNAINVLAGTKIRLEFANINNPLTPSASYKVTVTTRNVVNNIIDGPSQSTAYTIKQIGTNAIADGAIVPDTTEQASLSQSVSPQTSMQATATCPASHPHATGGGFTVNPGSEEFMHASDSFRAGPDKWEVFMYNSDPAQAHSFNALAECVAPMP